MEVSREEGTFWGVLAAFAAIGFVAVLGAHYFPSDWEVRRLLAGAAGEAFLVAALLALTVDRYIKSDLIRKASQDVHKYLVGYNLPDEIKERIQQLMGIAFIRRNWHISFTLRPINNSEVEIDVSYNYELENVSNEVQNYTPMIQIEKHLNPTILELRCDDPEIVFRLSSKAGESIGKEGNVPGLIELRHADVKIKPKGKDGLVYPFSAHFKLRTPNNHSDTFSFGQPSLGVTITTSCPSGYRFSVEPDPDMITTANMYQFRHRAFLRSEHVVVRWFKEDAQNNSSETSGSDLSADSSS